MSTDTIDTIAPATIAPAQTTDAAARLQVQTAAFLRDGPPGLTERRDDLTRLLHATKAAADEIVQAISADFGNRSRHETLLAEVWPVLSALRHTRKHLARWMKPRRVAVPLEIMPGRARIISQPVGVVGIISPWNYPFQLAVIPLLNALAAGNRVMLKPSELAPRTAEFLARFLEKLFPPEKVAVVLGGPDVAAEFAGLPFNHLIFTGSTAVGRKVMRAAAENLTPVTLELGGKSPCILGEDAAFDKAARSIAFGKLLNAGQTCIAPDYVLVPQHRLDDFVAAIGKAVPRLYPTLKANPDYTSIIDERHYRRLRNYLDEARAKGAKLIEFNPANEDLAADERKFAPTLVIDPDASLAVMNEEIFGPILPIKPYATLDDAIEFVNQRPRPLALYYFGADRAACDKVLRRTTAGGVSINDTMIHAVVDELPFGGTGTSGIGAYHGEIGFQTFSHRKAVFVQSKTNGTALLQPPFKGIKRALLSFMMRR